MHVGGFILVISEHTIQLFLFDSHVKHLLLQTNINSNFQ